MTCDTTLEACWRPSPNTEARKNGLKADMLILHYTAMTCGKKAVDWLCNPEAKVSSHYLVDEDGSITQMVLETERAWHAGVSYWAGETDINSCSIGIEIQNMGHALEELPEFPEIQMKSVKQLCLDIISRNKINPERVLGHSDVACGRKVDPGERFSWESLHKAGIGHWVKPVPVGKDLGLQLGDTGSDVENLQKKFHDYGYGIEINGIYDQITQNVVSAFQSHWRQQCVNGIADMSTMHTLDNLCSELEKS